MFTDQDWQPEKNKNVDLAKGKIIADRPAGSRKTFIAAISIAAVLLSSAGFAYFSYQRKLSRQPLPDKPKTVVQPAATTTPKLIGRFPEELDAEEILANAGTGNIKAEDFTFGMFYEKPAADYPASKTYDLPINVKTDAANYYEVARKFNLDPYLDQLNKNGFAYGEDILSGNTEDFFSAYRALLGKDTPIAITGDFLIYYFQNTLKSIYKDIEQNSFYNQVWDLNSKMYTISLAKYRKQFDETGISNDPALEGKRLELAYFAVALELLEPMDSEVDRRENSNDDKKYAPEEAEKYDLELPLFLSEDVEKEVALIRGGKMLQKSPIFLYEKDYREYKVPVNYLATAKLKNYYLAMKWLTSVFPLYFRDARCPDCLLDEDDWTVIFSAALNISDDLSKNQEIKNQWAVIYKFISFFSGLRRDLTFLDYHRALTGLYGENYDLDKVFDPADNDSAGKPVELRDKIAGLAFLPMEGGYDRNNTDESSRIGFRMLAERFSPDDYIFSALTGKDMAHERGAVYGIDIPTRCIAEKGKSAYRCRGFGLDIVNLFYAISPNNGYFSENTEYLGYQEAINALRAQIGKFDVNTWNNNLYWSTMDLNRRLLGGTNDNMPAFAKTQEWKQTREINTALGAWTSLKLEADTWGNYFEQESSTLGSYSDCSPYNYVEPNLGLVRELKAKNDMLIKMLIALNVAGRTSAALTQLGELNKKLAALEDMVVKELSGGSLDGEDCGFITDLASRYYLAGMADRSALLSFPLGAEMRESLDKVKIAAMVAEFKSKKMIVLGPVFGYTETAR